MKLLLHTASMAAIRQVGDYGVMSGVSTDPTVIAQEGRALEEVLSDITGAVPHGIVFVSVISLTWEKMVEEALELARISTNLEISIPMCAAGLRAIKILSTQGMRTNCTLIFSAGQALLAARAGAAYVSPSVGRLDDVDSVGVNLISDITKIFAVHRLDCQIIAASIRSPLHVVQCAKAGAHMATVPPAVVGQMIHHPLTDAGIQQFTTDWEALLTTL